jgi:hypothetical protein
VADDDDTKRRDLKLSDDRNMPVEGGARTRSCAALPVTAVSDVCERCGGATDRKPETPTELLVSISEFCRRVGVKRTTAWKLARAKEITIIHIRRRSLVTVASMEKLVARGTDSGDA